MRSRSLRYPPLFTLFTLFTLTVPALLALLCTPVAAGSAPSVAPDASEAPDTLHSLPWRQAGLTEREAAAHLLDRFAFGPRPGQVEEVVAMGLERWLEGQLAGDLPEPELARRLEGLRTLGMSGPELARTYPNPGLVLQEAQEAGVIPRDMDPQSARGAEGEDRRAIFEKVKRWGARQGYRPQRELLGELLAQKLLRAVAAENQLTEVLTDFWYNHFYVSLADNETRSYVLAYERDAIRPHVLGPFRTLLGATAHHPAMLLYLDNARSVANAGSPTTLEERMAALRRGRPRPGGRQGSGRFGGQGPGGPGRRDQEERFPNRPRGLNENYARELMELHTLGVEGGYTQEDVVAVARAFSGWALVPPGRRGKEVEGHLARFERAGQRWGTTPERLGFVVDGYFLFRADAHDAGAKTILGRKFPAGRGLEDGEEVLDLLAAHPATARHLASRLAVRFVSDDPPPALVDRLARAFTTSRGDPRQVLRTLAGSPEFWAPQARAAKVKSPFELAVSALRGLGARVGDPRGTLEWIARMGQPLYLYQAPTGYPEQSREWVNTGALLHRMNFGLELAAGRVEGVRFDLAALAGGREPASREEALTTWLDLLLPGRDHGDTVELLLPVIHDPALARKVAEAAPQGETPPEGVPQGEMTAQGDLVAMGEEMEAFGDPLGGLLDGPRRRGHRRRLAAAGEPTALEQVVGVILGSPAFQQR